MYCALAGVFLLLGPLVSAQERKAVAVLSGPNPNIRGNVTFHQKGDTVFISGTVEGLKKGLHGFHVHEKGDITGGCTTTGAHFNPYKMKHGGPLDSERHVGDLGNIEANDNGIASISMSDKMIQLQGPNCIIGRAILVHADEDDLGRGGHEDSLTTGHAGGRLACGVIGILDHMCASSVGGIYIVPSLMLFTFLIAFL